MKKALVLGLVGLFAASLFGDVAAGARRKRLGKPQVVKGSIALRAPFPPGNSAPLDSCYSGLHRRGAVFTDEQNNGVVGYHFNVNRKSIGMPFTLKVTGGQGAVDLDITFYTEFGTTEQATDTQYAPPSHSFEKRRAGGEAGRVPAGMKKAIVCMYDGANSTFTYTAQTRR